MTAFYCGLCDHVTDDAGQARAHVETQHAGLMDWLTDRLGGDPLPLEAAVWYWAQDQDPARDGWQPATVTGWGGKDGCPVYDVWVDLPGYIDALPAPSDARRAAELTYRLQHPASAGGRWGWAWQVIPRAPYAPTPTDRPGALRGEFGPWP